MPISRLKDFVAALQGAWGALRYDPFWFNLLRIELEYDPETLDWAHSEETLGFRQTLLAVSAITLSDDCLPLDRQVEKAAEQAIRMRVMASRLISAGLTAKLHMIRIKKDADLNPQEKVWKIMAVQFARDAMIYSIIQRSKVGTLDQENVEILKLARHHGDLADRSIFGVYDSGEEEQEEQEEKGGATEEENGNGASATGSLTKDAIFESETFESETRTPRKDDGSDTSSDGTDGNGVLAPSENVSGAIFESET
eukprot:SAG22_NODE_1549_length_4150_cov_2.766477_1_plen_254_part_10